MPTKYSYIKKDGSQGEIDAESSATALKAPDIAPNSGVITPTLSPTVLTDANIRENTIPDVKNRMMKYVTPPVTTTPTTEETPEEKPIESPYGDYGSLLETAGLKGTSAKDVDAATLDDPGYQRFNEIYKRAQNSNDKQYKAALDSIKLNTNKMRQRAAQGSQAMSAILTGAGSTRYAPQGAISASTRYDLDNMEEIQTKEELAIAKATEAFNSNDMQLAQDMLNQVDSIRKEKRDIATKINEKLIEENKKARETEYQASRDNAVVSLLSQGITDPVKILNYLNFDEQGNEIGDFGAEEVSGIMEKIAKANNYQNVDKLSADLRDYYILKDIPGGLPSSISSLPPEQQLSAFLNMFHPKKAGGNGSVNKITVAEADKYFNGARYLVGLSEEEVLNDLNGLNPPEWFTKKTTEEKMQNLLPEEMQRLWEEYRQAYFADAGEATNDVPTATENKSKELNRKVKNYFGTDYDLTDEDLESLTDRVQYYMDGGMSYSDALAATKKEIQ